MNALEALKKIRDDVGICGNVEETMPYELKELMVEWPANAAKLHSLRQNYPVEGTGDEYELSAEAGTLWENPRRQLADKGAGKWVVGSIPLSTCCKTGLFVSAALYTPKTKLLLTNGRNLP